MPDQTTPHTVESLINNDPELAETVVNAMTSQLFGDVKSLHSEVHRLAQGIESLSPSLTEVEDKWLKAKSKIVSEAFKNDIRDILKNETKESFSKVATEITKSNDYLRLAIEDINRFSVLTLVASIAAGAISGTCIFVILLYLN